MFLPAFRRSIPFLLGACAIYACANSGKSPPDMLTSDDGGGSGSGSGSGGSSGNSGSGGSSGSVPPGDDGGVIVIPDAGKKTDACQQFDVTFAPRIPLVYVLVDRSGSMFTTMPTGDGGNANEWDPLRSATLAVIQSLQSQVAFGFTSYTGINPSTTPGMCPILSPDPSTVPIALNNYSAIASPYMQLGMPMFKAETPAQKSLVLVGQLLTQAALQTDAGGGGVPGGKYILFVTDGETDFCDDGDPVCPADAVIAELQKLSSQGITTLILGIGSNQSNISVPVLQSFANAGAGIPALAPPNSAQGAPLAPSAIYNECNSVTGWNQLWSAAGLTQSQALANYQSLPMTNATVYSPSATDVGDLTNKIAAALSTVKNCFFDIQGKLKVDLPNANKGSVTIDGMTVPFDSMNGWTMPNATEIDLVGSACQQWRATGKDIKFAFPCDVIINLQ